MAGNVDIRSLNCPSCGAKLNITRSFTDVVFCESCGTKCVISGLNVNEEILKKNNINSGVPFSGTPEKIHGAIFGFITTSKNFSIDVLQDLEIVEVKQIIVPAYLYTCSAFATYTYEAGNDRVQNQVVSVNGQVVNKQKKYTEWTQMSSIANDTRTVVVCGNKAYMEVINRFYGTIDPQKLVDVEDLSYPEDITTESFNVPEATAFSQNVKPAFSGFINQSARAALQNRKTRNFQIGQPNIQKEYEARISLGLYYVKCLFKNRSIDIYLNADVSEYYSKTNPPQDIARSEYIRRLRDQLASIKPTWLSDFFSGGFAKVKENKALQQEEKDRINHKITSVINEPQNAKQFFISNNCRLKGIYSEGYPQFNWESPNPEVPLTPDPFAFKLPSAQNNNVSTGAGGSNRTPITRSPSSNNNSQYTSNTKNKLVVGSSRDVVIAIIIVFFIFSFISSLTIPTSNSQRTTASSTSNITSLSVSLNDDVELYVGAESVSGFVLVDVIDQQAFTADDIVFVSEDSDIATITYSSRTRDSSLHIDFDIDPISVGETYVYAVSADGTVSSKHIKVTVKEYIEIESFSLEEGYSLVLGESIALNPAIQPEDATDKSVVWASSDENVVSVDADGNIIGVGSGEAIITGTVANGMSDECVVTVDGSRRVFNLSVNRTRDDANSIGDDWSHASEINGEAVSSGSYIVAIGDTLTFYVRSSEDDDIPDVGETSITYTVTEEDFNNGFSVTLEVYPTEGNGPNSGLSAHFVTTFAFEL